MTDVNELVENLILEHAGMSKEEVSAYNRQYYLRNKHKWDDNSSAAAEKRLMRARAAAEKLPPEKRNAVLKKLDKLQRKLSKLIKSNTKTKVKTFGDFPKAFPKKSNTKATVRSSKQVGPIRNPKRAGNPKSSSGNIKDISRAGGGKSINIRDTRRAGGGR